MRFEFDSEIKQPDYSKREQINHIEIAKKTKPR